MTTDKIKVLVVDDNSDIAQGTAHLLEQAGYGCSVALGGAEALAIMQTDPASLVLLDWDMPEMDGLTVCRQIKTNPALADVLVILVSGLNTESDQQVAGLSAGADGFIARPIPNRELVARVEAYTRIISLGRSLREQTTALQATNTELRRSNAAALNLMEDAMVARDRLEVVNQELQREITERKRAQNKMQESHNRLNQALEQLKAAQKHMVEQERLHALGQMASGIAHDFNNALAPILGFSELLLYRPEKANDPATVKNFLEMINTSAKDAAHIVRRLREFYRHRERGEIFLPLDLNHLILQTVGLTQPRWKEQAQATGIKIDWQSDLGNIPHVYCDESEIRELLTNLIFNAVDAMPTGGTMTVRTRAEGDSVMVEFSDTGSGMTEEVRRRCLEPFFSTKGEGGTGLGLAMVYGVVKRHNATLDIRSEVGKGTTFVIHFPVEIVPQTPPASPRAKAATRPLHVLVVDDEQMVLDVITDYLTGDGHSVATADGGDQALAKFERAQFDLVITDRSMPNGNGEQLATAIKARQPDVPVIMLTGFGGIMDVTGDCLEGVDCLLSKPITLREIQNAVARMCPANKKETNLENSHR